MNDLNAVPKTGTFGNAVDAINTNFALLQMAYQGLTQSALIPVSSENWPVNNPEEGAIYRVSGDISYTDYMWNGTEFIPMATYNNAIDTAPTKNSGNPISSGAVLLHGSALDISMLNATGSTPATYATLSAALAAVPSNKRQGGMTVKYIDSTTNRYVQYRLLSTSWSTNVADWEKQGEVLFLTGENVKTVGIDNEPILDSANLVKSNGIFNQTHGYRGIDFIKDEYKREATITASNKWGITSNYSYVLSIIPGNVYKVVAPTGASTIIAVLKSIDNIGQAGESPDFSDTYPGRISLDANSQYVFIAPPDAAYIYLLGKSSSGVLSYNFYVAVLSGYFKTGEDVVNVGIDNIPTTGSNDLVKSGGVYANTLEEKDTSLQSETVAGYVVSKEGFVVARLLKNGAFEFLAKNERDKHIDDIIEHISTELPETDTNIVKYITDERGVIIATIDDIANTQFVGGGFDSEVTQSSKIDLDAIKAVISKNNYVINIVDNSGNYHFLSGGGFAGELTETQAVKDIDAVKVITDSKRKILGWVTSTGKIHLIEAEVEKLQVGNSDVGVPDFLVPLTGIIANGISNRKMVNDKVYNLLDSIQNSYKKDGVTVDSIPCITLYDDDAFDYQLPTSYIRNAAADHQPSSSYSKRGGYASLLFPIVHAFNCKYKDSINGKVTCFEAGEGQRIGLTGLYAHTDDFNGELNNNGKVLKRIIETGEWEVVCHSMTARYVNENYLVDGIDSEFANEVLANSVWHGDLVHNTTTCYDSVTKKNYQAKQDKSEWEEIPDHYAKPYCAVDRDVNGRLVINPTYSVKYQVDEWFKRADIARLPYSMKDVGKRVYANWGTSHSIWHIRQNLKYADYGFGGTAQTNTIPLDTVVHRFNWQPKVAYNTGAVYANYSGDFNVYTEAEYQRLINMINICIENKGWSFLGCHSYEISCANYYFDALVNFIPEGESEPINIYDTERSGDRLNYYDENYPEEWAVPLKYEELQDIIGENNHDYLNNPPERLGIDSWAEWYPCPGTGCALLWDAMRYAVDNGVRFVTAEEGFERFGNLLTLGFKFTNNEVFSEDKRLGDIPEESTAHCIIGADGSIDYNKN